MFRAPLIAPISRPDPLALIVRHRSGNAINRLNGFLCCIRALIVFPCLPGHQEREELS